MDNTHLYIFARFHSKEGYEQEVSEALREEIPLARAEAGCVSIDAYNATRYPQLFFIYSCWRDEAAFDLHAEMPHTIHFLERVTAAIDHPLDVTRTQLIY